MSKRAIFGVTDSPREAERKRKAAEREDRLLERDREFVASLERDERGMPARLYFRRNPHYRPARSPGKDAPWG